MIARNILTLSLFTISYVTVSHTMIPRRTLPLLQNHAAPLSKRMLNFLPVSTSNEKSLDALIEIQQESVALAGQKVDEQKRAFHNAALFATGISGSSMGCGLLVGMVANDLLHTAHHIDNLVLAAPIAAAGVAGALWSYALIGGVPLAGIQFARLGHKNLRAARLELQTETAKLQALQERAAHIYPFPWESCRPNDSVPSPEEIEASLRNPIKVANRTEQK